jgi:hypothetical protein
LVRRSNYGCISLDFGKGLFDIAVEWCVYFFGQSLLLRIGVYDRGQLTTGFFDDMPYVSISNQSSTDDEDANFATHISASSNHGWD